MNLFKKSVLFLVLGFAPVFAFTNDASAATDYTKIIPPYDASVDAVHAPTGFGTGKVWQVGPTRTYKKPSDVADLVGDGDVVEVDAATYKCDTGVKWKANFLTLIGVGGRPILDATGCGIPGGKGIWNPYATEHDLIINNFEFVGASVGDANGAGIRADSTGYLYITNSFFHDNQNGVLITPDTSAPSNIVIDHSEFSHNGTDAGNTHNMYISNAPNSFVLRFSYSHDSHVGHEVKSRALSNYILYNRLADEVNGDSSYNIDLPQGGLSYIIGNLIQQGPNSPNYAILSYSAEDSHNPIQKVYVSGNTIVNNGNANAIALNLYDNGLTEAKMVNNLIVGVSADKIVGVTPGKITLTNNIVTSSPGFNTSNTNFALNAGSPAINAGVDPGSAGSFSLVPKYEFVYPNSAKARPSIGALDVGGYEYDQSEVVAAAPTISLAAANSTVNYNASANLTWSSTNAINCLATGGWVGAQSVSGSFTTVALTSNKTFMLTCTGPGGSASKSVSVTVNDSAAATALGTYVWQDIPGSMINTVCPDNGSTYEDNKGTGPWCESRISGGTGVYIPELAKYYIIGGGYGRNAYGNEVYDFNFATGKAELVTTPTHISQTKEYAPDDLYGSKIHLTNCEGVVHLTTGGTANAPRATNGAAAYNPITKKIIVGPGGYVSGLGDCSSSPAHSNYGDQATDIWSFDPFKATWSQVAPENDKFGGVGPLAWFLDPATGISYVGGNRNGATRGGYLINNNATPPTVALVDNAWPFSISYGPFAVDTVNHYALQLNLDTPPTAQFYNLNSLSMTKYGTAGSGGSTGAIGGSGPLFEPDTTWTFTGDTSVLSMSGVAITYNSKLSKFVVWAGKDMIYFLTPNYQTKVMDILAKRVYGNPTATTDITNKFTYIADKDVYIASVGTDQDFFYLVPPTSTTPTSSPTPTPTPTTPTPTPIPTPQPTPTPSPTPSTSTFQIGAQIKTVGNLNVRKVASALGSKSCTQSTGAVGTIIGGPITANGYVWWNINYNLKCDGWSIQNYLKLVPVAGTPNPTQVPTSYPASGLTAQQTAAIVLLLQSFGAGADVIAHVQAVLGGSTTSTPTPTPTSNPTPVPVPTPTPVPTSTPTPTPVPTPTPTPTSALNDPCAGRSGPWTTLTVTPSDNIKAAFVCVASGPFKLTLAAGDYHQTLGVPPGHDGFDIGGASAATTKVHMLGCLTAENNPGARCAEGLTWGKGVIHLQSSGTVHDMELADGGIANVNAHDLQAGLYVEAGVTGTVTATHIMFRNNQNGMASNPGATGANIVLNEDDFVGNSTDGGSHSSYLGGGASVTYNNIHDYGSRFGNDQKSRVGIIHVNGGFFKSIEGRWFDSSDGSVMDIHGGTFVGNTCCQNVFGNGSESVSKGPGNTTWEGSTIWLGRSSNFTNTGTFQATNITMICGAGSSAINSAGTALTGLPSCPATASVPPVDPPYISGALNTVADAGTGNSLSVSPTSDSRGVAVATGVPLVHSLGVGWSGKEVTALQTALAELGQFQGEATGYFGEATKKAVKNFQQSNNLSAVGVVGPETRALLLKLIGQ